MPSGVFKLLFLRMFQTLDIRVFGALCVSCIQVFCDVQYSLKCQKWNEIVFRERIRWLAFLWWWQHIASAAPKPIAARPTFHKMFDRSPDESDHGRNCSDCHSYSEKGRMCIA